MNQELLYNQSLTFPPRNSYPFKLSPLFFWNQILGSGILFYLSYIHSRTMFEVPMERTWKDESNRTPFSKSPNIGTVTWFSENADAICSFIVFIL